MYNTKPIMTVRPCAISDSFEGSTLTKIEPEYYGMGPKSIHMNHVSERKLIQLRKAAAPSGMDG